MPPPRQHQKNKTALSTPTQDGKSDRFTALLTEIRRGLASQWILYEECIEGILEAAAQKQDTTAWFEQLQRLVSGNDQVQFSHEGVIFLLRDMGIRPSEQQSQIEGKMHGSKYLSLPLSPPQANFIRSAPSSTAERNSTHARSTSNTSMSVQPSKSRQGESSISEQGQPFISEQGESSISEQGQTFISEQGQPSIAEQGQTFMSEQGQTSIFGQGQTFNSRQGQTNVPVLAKWPVTHAPTPNTHLQKKLQNQVLELRAKGKPFDKSVRRILPELTYPRDLQAFFHPSEDVVLDPDRWVPRVNPFKPRSIKTVLFEDPTMKEKVLHMFGYTARWRDSIPNGPDDIYIREINRLPYDPEEDDLAAWMAKLEGSAEGEEDQMKASDHITQWPPWKKRYDLEL